MRIAVNAASLNNHLLETFLTLAKLHPEHTFLFLFDQENSFSDLPKNTIPVVITPPATIPLKWQIWYNLKLPASFKKNKVDVFISEKFISLKTKVPQILISPDLTFLHHPALSDKKQIAFDKKNTQKFLEKANQIIVNSIFLKNEITARFKIPEEKVSVIYPITQNLSPATFEEKEMMKEKHADDNEYFIYKGIISPEKNLVNLLKAFSFFKKRQRSKMQLIITGERGAKYEEFVGLLQSYRFKNDVKIVEDIPENETAKILSSAYAMTYVPFYETEGDEVIEAMKAKVPLILSETPLLKEYGGDAALYADPKNINDIAEKMMSLFKDEQKRKELIEKEKLQVTLFENTNATENLFKIITEAQNKNT